MEGAVEVRALDPRDPIDLAAIREVDALTSQVAPLESQLLDGELEAKFKRLEKQERDWERRSAKRREKQCQILDYFLGEGWMPDPYRDDYVSRDGRKRITRHDLLGCEARGWDINALHGKLCGEWS
jgi:hypothetical protein